MRKKSEKTIWNGGLGQSDVPWKILGGNEDGPW